MLGSTFRVHIQLPLACTSGKAKLVKNGRIKGKVRHLLLPMGFYPKAQNATLLVQVPQGSTITKDHRIRGM